MTSAMGKWTLIAWIGWPATATAEAISSSATSSITGLPLSRVSFMPSPRLHRRNGDDPAPVPHRDDSSARRTRVECAGLRPRCCSPAAPGRFRRSIRPDRRPRAIGDAVVDHVLGRGRVFFVMVGALCALAPGAARPAARALSVARTGSSMAGWSCRSSSSLGLRDLRVRARRAPDRAAARRPAAAASRPRRASGTGAFGYPDDGAATTRDVLHIPAGQPVDVVVTTRGRHPLLLGAAAWRQDRRHTRPRERASGIEADRPGIYRGVCAEFCGNGHTTMRFTVEAHEPEDYDDARETAVAEARPMSETRSTDAVAPAQGARRRSGHTPRGLQRLAAVNHTMLGKRFIVAAFVFFAIGGVLAMLIRAQLATPRQRLRRPRGLQPDLHHARHGDDVPVRHPDVRGAGDLLLPKLLGARDLAFPRLTAYGFWCYLFGGIDPDRRHAGGRRARQRLVHVHAALVVAPIRPASMPMSGCSASPSSRFPPSPRRSRSPSRS